MWFTGAGRSMHFGVKHADFGLVEDSLFSLVMSDATAALATTLPLKRR